MKISRSLNYIQYNTQSYKNDKIYGINILRMILAFLVIVRHNFSFRSTNNKFLIFILKERKFHVPCFMNLSFYFNYNRLISCSIKKYQERFKRLLIPYIGWSIIIWTINNIYNKIFYPKFDGSIFCLIKHIFCDCNLIGQFWFQYDLIIITIIFAIIIFFFRKNNLFVLYLLFFFCYFWQYSGYNMKLYKKIIMGKENFGRMAEVFPFAVTGFHIASMKILDMIKFHKYKTLFLSIFIFYICNKFDLFADVSKIRISYAGLVLNINSICIIFIFFLIPSKIIESTTFLKSFLKNLTNFTGGIFYLHWNIIKYFQNIIYSIKEKNIFGCIIIYLICYFICLIGTCFFGKTRLKYLFI